MSDQPRQSKGWLVLAAITLAVVFVFFVPVRRLDGILAVRYQTTWQVITE